MQMLFGPATSLRHAMMRRHLIAHRAMAGLFWPLLLAAVTTGFSPSPGRAQAAQPAIDKAALVGSWQLVSIRTWLVKTVEVKGQEGPSSEVTGGDPPYGPNPKGRLIFESNRRFSSTVLNSDGSSPASNNPGAPKEFEKSSGTYSMHPNRWKPATLIFTFDAHDPRLDSELDIEISKLTEKDLEFDTSVPPGGGWYSSFVYRRAE